MTEPETDPLVETADRLFDQHLTPQVRKQAEAAHFPASLWAAVEEAGFPAALLTEEAGGFGLTAAEAFRILSAAASHAAPIPLAETMLATSLLARAGLPVPAGVLTLAPTRPGAQLAFTREAGAWHLRGTAARVPWGRDAASIAVLAEGPEGPMLACLAPPEPTRRDANLAGEPRDTLVFDHAVQPVPAPLDPAQLRLAGAALRTAQIAGALSRTLALSVDYAQTRIAFGRPIGKFQAIQQNLALLAEHAAAAIAASGTAAAAFATLDPLPIAAAKARAGEAASLAAAIAHQVHGAIGFTIEFALHPLTRRLWSWRDEWGNEAEWNALVGRTVLQAGPAGLWSTLAAA